MERRKPNWLLRGLIIASIGFHAVVLLHVSGIYRSRALSVIELTLSHVGKPRARAIPRPRPRPRQLQPITATEKITAVRRPVPVFKPVEPAPTARLLPDSRVESVRFPETPQIAAAQISDWVPMKVETPAGTFATTGTYLEMVKLRIEQHKVYPESVRSRQIEGRVTVQFVIGTDGGVVLVQIVRRSRSKGLNRAALDAVKNAAPFPVPPKHLFRDPIRLTVTVVFELT